MSFFNFLFNIRPEIFFPVVMLLAIIIALIFSGDEVKANIKIALLAMPVLVYLLIKISLMKDNKINVENDNKQQLDKLKDKIDGNISVIKDTSKEITNKTNDIRVISKKITSEIKEVNETIVIDDKDIIESQKNVVDNILKYGFEREEK